MEATALQLAEHCDLFLRLICSKGLHQVTSKEDLYNLHSEVNSPFAIEEILNTLRNNNQIRMYMGPMASPTEEGLRFCRDFTHVKAYIKKHIPMTEKDYLILFYLSKQSMPICIDDFPTRIKIQYDESTVKQRSLIHALWILNNRGLINEPTANYYQINTEGRLTLREYLKNLRSMDVSAETLLRYFYVQNKKLTIDDLFKKFGNDASILKPINTLSDNDWLAECEGDALCWEITDLGKKEYQGREQEKELQRSPKPQSVTITGNIGNVNYESPNAKSSVDISYKTETVNKNPAIKKKIDWGLLLKIVTGIIAIAFGILKFFGVL